MILDKLPKKILEVLKICSFFAKEHNVKLYLIGGVVRDLLLGVQTLDIDVCMEFNAVEYSQMLEKNGYGQILQVQPDLKTAKFEFKNGIVLDFASTRKENYPRASYLPVITDFYCPLKEDISRRDFTLNSLAISLCDDNFGEIVDFLGGVEDLENKKLKILHKKSFADDPSRIIRALKYSLRYGLSLEDNTEKSMGEYLNNFCGNICYSRILSEIKLTFGAFKEGAFENFYAWDLQKLFLCEENNFINDLSEVFKIFGVKDDWFSYFACILCHSFDISKICEILNLELSQKKILTDFMELKNTTYEKTKLGIYKNFINKDVVAQALYYAIFRDENVIDFKNNLSKIKNKISGDDLIQLGLTPSKEFSKILDMVLEKNLNGDFETKEDELIFIKNNFCNNLN